jgi:hypothetical protein
VSQTAWELLEHFGTVSSCVQMLSKKVRVVEEDFHALGG